MNLLQNQTYVLWFQYLGDKLIEWSDAKPANTDLKNCVKAISEIGTFTNGLRIETEVLQKRVDLIRSQKNEIIMKQKEKIQELENKLKQYEI
jgi:hypothetical protein